MMNDTLELDYAEMLRYIGLVVSDGKCPKFYICIYVTYAFIFALNRQQKRKEQG